MNPDSSIKLPLTTPDIAQERLDQLKTLFPDAFCDGKFDSEKLKQLIGEKAHVGAERYGLNWAGKSDAIRSLQHPSHATLRPMKEESVNFDTSENMIIEGDNLEVLKLLQRSYHGKIKMIYIDPPYNTGNDFIYPDNFKDSLGQYLKYSGQTGEDGLKQSTNSETNGRYHSNWLNMMYPRLFLAKNLLRDDGVIFVSIDDHEQANLKLMMDEIFGGENFVANIIWQKKYAPSNDAKWLSDNHDFIVCYARNKEIWRPNPLPRSDKQTALYRNLDKDPRGNWKPDNLSVKSYSEKYDYPITTPSGRVVNPPRGRCWLVSKEKFEELLNDKRIWFGESGNNVPSLKRFLSEVKEGVTPLTVWPYSEVGHNQDAKKEIKTLFTDEEATIFDTPKPTSLLKRLLQISVTDNSDVVLDFFAGSGSLADAVFHYNKESQKNIHSISVQLPEKFGSDKETIADITRERVRRVIQKIKTEQEGQLGFDSTPQDLGFKAFRLDSSNFKLWDGASKKTPEELAEALTLFSDNVQEGRTQDDMLFEIILKAGQSLTAKIEKTTIENQSVYSIADGAMLVCLEDPIHESTLKAILALKPAVMIALDRAFHGNDQLKTNIKLQAEQSGESEQSRVLFRTV
jgi:adenine-specific DNA-methyltransferase